MLFRAVRAAILRGSPRGSHLRMTPEIASQPDMTRTSETRSRSLLAVAIKTLAGLAAEVARGDHFLQERRRAVFRVVEAVVKHFHHRQHGVEPDHVSQRQRADRMVASKLH